jgi:hypothetical protein
MNMSDYKTTQTYPVTPRSKTSSEPSAPRKQENETSEVLRESRRLAIQYSRARRQLFN